MKLTSLVIQPTNTWAKVGPKNPLRAVVKLESEESTVECVLGEETMRRMLDLCADEIAQNAERNVQEFVSAVSALDASKDAALISKID